VSDPTDTPTTPTPDEIAQALCLADCARKGSGGCTWESGRCVDMHAMHYEDEADAALARWRQYK
jgi:hypothetical protein